MAIAASYGFRVNLFGHEFTQLDEVACWMKFFKMIECPEKDLVVQW